MYSIRILNSVCSLIVCSILLGALYFQFFLGEDPCPLCLLQRMGMMGVIFGLILNIQFGFNVKHFSLVIFAALVGLVFSTRQVLLHICPEVGVASGYGTPVFGMHLYTWGVFIFLSSILGSALFLLFSNRYKMVNDKKILAIEKLTLYLSFIIIAINVIATFFECQLGPCCENGPCL